MCFPDAHDWSKSIEKTTSANDFDEDQNYVTSLTTEAGLRKYVYCRRIKPEGESFSLPLSYCILSSHKANEFYFKVSLYDGKITRIFFNFVNVSFIL